MGIGIGRAVMLRFPKQVAKSFVRRASVRSFNSSKASRAMLAQGTMIPHDVSVGRRLCINASNIYSDSYLPNQMKGILELPDSTIEDKLNKISVIKRQYDSIFFMKCCEPLLCHNDIFLSFTCIQSISLDNNNFELKNVKKIFVQIITAVPDSVKEPIFSQLNPLLASEPKQFIDDALVILHQLNDIGFQLSNLDGYSHSTPYGPIGSSAFGEGYYVAAESSEVYMATLITSLHNVKTHL